MRISDLLKKEGEMEICCHCSSKIGPKYSNEFYRLNNKVYCSVGCFTDRLKIPEKKVKRKKK